MGSAEPTMQALMVTDLDTPPELQTVTRPKPVEGEILVRIHACALNFADLLLVEGRYQEKPPLPFSPGLEVAGEVVALGSGVSGPPEGTRVAVTARGGGLADYGIFPASRAVILPPEMPMDQAAAFQVAYGTSHVALEHKARLQPGETLLVTGAAGGVGLTAVEIGHLMGAQVIAVARGAEKLSIAQAAGADHLIDADADILAEVKALGGADVAYETIGGAVFDAALRSLRPGGRILPIGFAGGSAPKVAANYLLVKNLSVLGLYWGGYANTHPAVIADSLSRLLDWIGEGRLAPHISHRLPLDRALEGFDMLRARASTGKIVVTMRHPSP